MAYLAGKPRLLWQLPLLTLLTAAAQAQSREWRDAGPRHARRHVQRRPRHQ